MIFLVYLHCFMYTYQYYALHCYRYRKAQLALQKGEEDLAREALKRRKSYAVCSHFLECSCSNIHLDLQLKVIKWAT